MGYLRDTQALFEADTPLTRRLTPALLILTNLVPIFGVVFWNWDVVAIVTLYWAENLVIGGITILRMLRVSPIGGIGTSIFFILHYGGFAGGHGLFLASIFEIGNADALDNLSWPFFFVFIEMLVRVTETIFSAAPSAWVLAVIAIGLSHCASFAYHVIGQNEDAGKSVNAIMGSPYGRVVILHITIIAGAMAVEALGSSLGLLLVLVLVKIIVDLGIHLRRHRQPEAETEPLT